MDNIYFTTIGIFLWKHWKCLRYSWIKNIFMIIVPILIAWFHIYVTSGHANSTQVVFDPINEDELRTYFPSNHDDLILYTPNTSFFNEIMYNVRMKLEIIEERLQPFETEEELNNFFQQHNKNRDFAVIFDGNSTAAAGKQFKYTIRTRNNNFQTDQIFWNNVYDIANKATDEYIDSGFLALQQSLDRAFIEQTADQQNVDSFDLELEKFPLNARERKQFVGIKQTVIFIVIIYSFTALLNMILVPMVEEKGCGVKEFLRIASCKSYLNNVTFYFTNLFIGCIMFGTTFVIAHCYQIITHIVCGWLLLLLFLYLVSAIAFTFLLSVAFDSVYYAKVGGFLCYIAPFLIVLFNEKMMNMILPVFNSAVLLKGLDIFDTFGQKGLVFSCQYLSDRSLGFSMCDLYLFLLADSLVYILLYFYLSHVFPGRCGTPKPFYFMLMPSYYRRGTNKVISSDGDNSSETIINVDGGGEVAVKIRGLTKVFERFGARKNVAVNNLSLDITKNQITVLLGHNGAGKTTTMSMISGIIPKTSGLISVDDEENVDLYRHKIGYCPQHNVFMSYFTCLDHLWFFGRLRGLSPKQAQIDAETLLHKLKMSCKADEYGNNLSGGMKRRLCLGNALIGNTKIAILDEPSSGLDPESRRELWNILLEMRKDQTIFITTHYMEEAETLADKIAIISHGTLLCYGPSIQLKRKYETGYVLKLLTTERFSYSLTMETIRRFVPDAKEKAFVKPTLTITLPYKYQITFADMLRELENQQVNLGITSISITNSSLEDVFLKSDANYKERRDDGDEVDSTTYNRLRDDPIRISGFEQFQAILYKKLIFMREQWVYWFMLFAFPIAAILVSFLSINYKLFHIGNLPSRQIDLHIGQITPDNAEILVWLEDSLSNRMRYQQILHGVIEDENLQMRLLTYPRDQIENELLTLERGNISRYHEHIPAALVLYTDEDSKKLRLKLLFSGNSLHSLASTINLVNNFQLKLLGNENDAIRTTNAPLHRNQTKISKADLEVYSMLLPMAIFFYILFYVSMPFNEERTEFKKLQPISPCVYWISVYLFDACVHLIYCYLLYWVHILIDTYHIFDHMEYVMFFTIYLMYGLAYLPIIYVIGQTFSTMSSVYSFLTYMWCVFYILASFISSSDDNMKTYDSLILVLLVAPDYAVSHALNALFIKYVKHRETQYHFNFDHKYSAAELVPNTFSYIGQSDVLDLTKFYIYMTSLIVVVFIILVFICENIYRREKLINIFTFNCRRSKEKGNSMPLSCCTSNSEVQGEKFLARTLVRDKKVDDYAIIVSNLKKNYNDFTAVNGIDFAVKKGECFGLLGVNGAGKTSTFKMLTHDTTISQGDVYINGMSCYDHPTLYKNLFGYCPQTDALNSYMTAFEILKYMAWIRGTPRHKLRSVVEKWLNEVDLMKYKNVKIKNYSGGTKRKLNTAIAMIAVPHLVFLDEPTTGVDPVSRRFMWTCIQDCQKSNKNIVLTSHSMDECEFLCNRLAIMACGQLKCIGPIQNLKESFGLGFIIHIVFNGSLPDAIDSILSVKDTLRDMFTDCRLQEEYAGRLTFIVKEQLVKWSEIFEKITKIRNRYINFITDISVNETSLEDIFLQIANHQICNSTVETVTV